MRRRTFDALVSGAGLLLVAVLVVAGVLLTWGHSYANNQVTSQLSAQTSFSRQRPAPSLRSCRRPTARRWLRTPDSS